MHPAWLDVCPYGDVGIETGTSIGINAMEPPVEEVVEALMDGISLAHNYCVTLGCRVPDGSYRVDL